MDVLEAIASKRAVRHFTDQPITDADLRAILNAGRRAQSSKNTQPWTFIAIRDRQTLQRLSECGAYAGHLAGAAVGVALLSAGPTGFDLGQAAAYLQLAAWELGIGSCIAIHLRARARPGDPRRPRRRTPSTSHSPSATRTRRPRVRRRHRARGASPSTTSSASSAGRSVHRCAKATTTSSLPKASGNWGV